MQSKAKTPKEYLDELPEDRRKDISAVRKIILENLPKGYEETMLYGMICYVVPLSMYPKGYGGNKNVPLSFICLANQKNYMTIHFLGMYGNKSLDDWFRKEYVATGKKLDMGKGCLRFKKLEDLPLDLIGEAVSKVSPEEWADIYDKARSK